MLVATVQAHRSLMLRPRLALPDTKPKGPPEAVANLALGLVRSATALDGSALLPYPGTPVSCQGASLTASEMTMPALLLAAASAVALGEPQSKGVLLKFDCGGGGKGEAGWSTPSKGKELTLVMMPLLLCMATADVICLLASEHMLPVLRRRPEGGGAAAWEGEGEVEGGGMEGGGCWHQKPCCRC